MTGTRRFSPSRLIEFVGCPHASALTLSGKVSPLDDTNNADSEDSTELVRRLGFEHERRVLEELIGSGRRSVEIPQDGSLFDRLAQTRAAIASGVDVIYQGALAHERWFGYPDFLLKVDTPHGYSYEPADAKLARAAQPSHLIQLSIYADALNAMSSSPIRHGTLFLGNGVTERQALDGVRYYIRRLQKRFAEFADSSTHDTRSWRCGACQQCRYQPRCELEWRTADSLFFVANIQSRQIDHLERAGISTMQQLSMLPIGQSIERIGQQPLDRLIKQAKKQVSARESERHSWEHRDVEPGRGFMLLPNPEAGDLFFDIEGDPFYPDGLDYLFGLYGEIAGKPPHFVAFWGHDHTAERRAFEQLMDLFEAQFQSFPKARIYHYAPYETTSLKRLAMRYATREEQLDQMLREQRFVDLYKVVRQGLIVSTEGYGLKDLEPVFGFLREGDIKTAGDSVVEYEQWRMTNDAAILKRIQDYNDTDCRATGALRDWLVSIRPSGAPYSGRSDSKDGDEVSGSEARAQRIAERQALADRVRAAKAEDATVPDLIAELLWFHQRAKKPEYWAMFDRRSQTDDELLEDIECIGGLRLDASVGHQTVKQSYVATFSYPAQETKLRAGNTVKIAATLTPGGTIASVDVVNRVLSLKRSKKAGEFPEHLSIIPTGPLDDSVLSGAIERFASRFAAGDHGEDLAVLDLLHRQTPRMKGRAKGQTILIPGSALVSGVSDAIAKLDSSYLFIQGPPGTGKTYTASSAILDRLREGARVAVASNSHKAINNLLAAVEARAIEHGYRFLGAKKATEQDEDTHLNGQFVDDVFSADDIHDGHRLVGGTAFLFAREDLESQFDYLFVDEAGQVSLANLVAMSTCARNIVLVGDQMQLPQPIKGVHPGESGLSVLEYLLHGASTVEPTDGVLLNVSWRMHPNLNQFISTAVYDGRLLARPENASRELVLDPSGEHELKRAGVMFKPISHVGCAQRSEEEASEIARLIDILLRQKLADGNGGVRPLTLNDIVVVAPYNMQVNLLSDRLPSGARVGTVDKFQGQEAAVSIVSMTTSSASEAPRGAEFLFSKNRLNVAVSRAKALSIVVASPTLLDYECSSIEEMKLVNMLCHLEQYSLQ